MEREKRLRTLLFLGRTLLFLFVIYHLNRYADGFVPPLFFLPFYAAALYGGALLARLRLRVIPALGALLLGMLSVWFLASGGFALLRLFVETPRVDALPSLFEFLFLPTAPTIAVAFLFAYLASRYRRFPVYEAFMLALGAFLTFFPQGEYELTLYDHPISVAVAAILVLASLLTVLGTSTTLEHRRQSTGTETGAPAKSRRLTRAALLFLLLLPVVLLSVLFVYNSYAEGSVQEGGGLLRPTLFRFDFSDYLSLESEISLSRDLVLLYHERRAPPSRLLRRYVLAGYSPERGFYREDRGFERVPDSVGSGPRRYESQTYRRRTSLEQEYYIVNFDPSSLIAVNYPVRVAPLRNWDDSSFNGIYRVESHASVATPEELGSVSAPGEKSEEWLRYYTRSGASPLLEQLAREVTADATGYYDKVLALERYLKEEYYYSLKPGAAPDGDQLSHFLFNSRKGYCSYFAFSMALMTRSLGIPSRVAVGFFLDPRQEVLNFHPVRANMAHAWVEVYFEEYGWIEFDPTSQQLAPGEEFDLSMGEDQEQVAALLEEIFSRYEELEELEREEELTAESGDGVRAAIERIERLVPGILALLLLGALFVGRNRLRLRGALARTPRRSSQLLFMHAGKRICGTPPGKGPPFRWPEELPKPRAVAVASLLELYQRAVFAPSYEYSEYRELQEHWKRIVREAPKGRRVVSLFLPVGMVPKGSGSTGGFGPEGAGEGPSERERGGGRGSHAKSAARTLLLIALFGALSIGVGSVRAVAQEQLGPEPQVETPRMVLDRAWQAIDNENYEEAIRILQGGQERFPEAIDISLLLGDLFYDRQLYSLALEAYQKAEESAPTDYDVLYSVATAYGRLNRERAAIEYLERLDGIHEAGPEVVSDLGWLYFKTHQLEKGERRLVEALREQGDDRYLTMTLGTIYADMYRYEESKRRYLQSIDSAIRDGAETFAAVAYYNLSLLEKSFYNFEDALSYTASSLELADRPSGYLAQGELYEQQMDSTRAYRNYRSAYVLDEETPLPKLSLAALYQRYGRLDDALAYTNEILEEENRGWMYNFGTDLSRHAMDIHGLLSDIYTGLARTRWLNRERTVTGFFTGLFDRVRYGILGWYHDVVFRRAAMRSADAYYDEGSTLNAFWTYRTAYDRRPTIALEYLEKARAFETEVIPESEPFYMLHEGVLRGEPRTIAAARSELDPLWERSEIATSLREELALLDAERDAEKYAARAAELLLMNAGAFQQYGLELPVRLRVEEGLGRGEVRKLRRYLAGRGIGVEAESDVDLVLTSEGSSAGRTVTVQLLLAGREIRRFRYGLAGGGRETLQGLAATIAGTIFRVELG
ncbi:MAG: transglutaminase domain-containing protein [Spirochaetaceae bacterium]